MPRVTAATQYRRHQLISSVFYVSDVESLMNPADYLSMFVFYRPDLWMTFDEWKSYQAAVIAAEPSLVHKAGVAYQKIERHSRAHWTYKDYGFDEMWPHLDTWYKTQRKRTLQSIRNRRRRNKHKHLEELTRAEPADEAFD